MKKIITICALAMLAIVAFVAGCPAREVSLVTYATADADLVGYINVQKLAANKIGKTLLAREDAKAQIAEFEKKTGLKADELLKSETAMFVNSASFKGKLPAMSVISRFKSADDQGAKIFAAIKKEDKDTKDIKVDGKKAITDKDGEMALIELGKNLLQVSSKQGDKGFVALKSGAETELAKAVDTTALMSVAYKVGAETRKLIKENVPMIPEDVTFITINIRENKDSIDAELVVKFEKAESAAAAKGTLVTLRDNVKDSEEAKQYKKNLEGLKIDAKGDALIITASEKVDEIIKLVNDATK